MMDFYSWMRRCRKHVKKIILSVCLALIFLLVLLTSRQERLRRGHQLHNARVDISLLTKANTLRGSLHSNVDVGVSKSVYEGSKNDVDNLTLMDLDIPEGRQIRKDDGHFQWKQENNTSRESGKDDISENEEIIEAVRRVRILCLILTMEKDINTKVKAVNSTWVARCDKHFYIIYSKQKRHDFLNIDVLDHRKNLIQKMRKAYEFIYKNYMNDFDFLLKADDDTFVIVDNLKYLLWHHDPNKPGYLGFHFNQFVKNGYMSGGAGYVISNRGLRHLVERGYQNGVCEIKYRKEDPDNSEDVETGRCLELAGVPILSSLDVHGRETFHAYPLERHLGGNLPQFMYSWAKHPMKHGRECCSRYTISYHYVQPHAIYYLHHVLYETTVFGLAESQHITGPMFNMSLS